MRANPLGRGAGREGRFFVSRALGSVSFFSPLTLSWRAVAFISPKPLGLPGP